jgi:ribosomal protein L21
MDKLAAEISARGLWSEEGPRANFTCALCLAWPDGASQVYEGRVFGRLVWPPRGDKGFGYDPMFRADGEELTFAPILLVDGDDVLTGSGLANASVTARIVGEAKGPKIRGFTYKNKTNQRRRWGHRQKYTTIEIVGISLASGGSGTAQATPAPAEEGII